MCGRRVPVCVPCQRRHHSSVVLALDLVLYCEAFLTTYRTFITPEELIKKLQYRYPFPWPPPLAPLLSRHRAFGAGQESGPFFLLPCALALGHQARLSLPVSFLV